MESRFSDQDRAGDRWGPGYRTGRVEAIFGRGARVVICGPGRRQNRLRPAPDRFPRGAQDTLGRSAMFRNERASRSHSEPRPSSGSDTLDMFDQ